MPQVQIYILGQREMIETFTHWRRQFWDRVVRGDGCWTWVGAYADDGYGILSIPRGDGRYRHARAHRLSYFIANGTFNESLFVLHSCDNTQCVNPDHLHLGTQADNMREKCQRGRARGNGHPKTPVVLPISQVNSMNRRVTKEPNWGKAMGDYPRFLVRVELNDTDFTELTGSAREDPIVGGRGDDGQVNPTIMNEAWEILSRTVRI